MSSSASPWQKYSWSFSGLRSVNGSTTIEERFVRLGPPLGDGLQVRDELPGRGVTALGILLQGLVENPDQPVGKGRIRRGGRGRRLVEEGVEERGECPASKRAPSGRHLVEHDAQREEVGADVHLLPEGLLGRHVAGGAEHRPRPVSLVRVIAVRLALARSQRTWRGRSPGA